MMTSYFNLLKYAATGIASPDMTYYDRMRASTLMGGVVQTLTGIPPLSFKSDGSPLISWSMKGNGSQTGTPTPDNPIMSTFCGVRTGNLFYSSNNQTAGSTLLITQTIGNSNFILNKNESQTDTSANIDIDVTLPAGTYTLSVTGLNFYNNPYDRLFLRDDNSEIVVQNVQVNRPQSFTLSETKHIYKATVVAAAQSTYSNTTITIMLNSGSTALPYEPFGWAEKITCAGQITPVYLGQVSTVRKIRKLVLTGEESSWVAGTTSLFILDLPDVQNGAGITSCICSHYNAIPNFETGYSAMPDKSISVRYNQLKLWIRDIEVGGLENFKSYLAQQYANGTPVTVWYVLATPTTGIVNEPLCKIGTYADELSSTDAAVTIPTVKGSNTLTVETDLQPSEMTITYRG